MTRRYGKDSELEYYIHKGTAKPGDAIPNYKTSDFNELMIDRYDTKHY